MKVTELMAALRVEVRRTGQNTSVQQMKVVETAADAVLDAQGVAQDSRTRHEARSKLIAEVQT